MWIVLLFGAVLAIGLRSHGDQARDSRHALVAVLIVVGYVAVTKHLL